MVYEVRHSNGKSPWVRTVVASDDEQDITISGLEIVGETSEGRITRTRVGYVATAPYDGRMIEVQVNGPGIAKAKRKIEKARTFLRDCENKPPYSNFPLQRRP